MKGYNMNDLQATTREIEAVENYIRTKIPALSFLYSNSVEVIARAALRWCEEARDLSESQLDDLIGVQLWQIRKVQTELAAQSDSRVLGMGTLRMEMMVRGIAMANSFELREDIAALLVAQRIANAIETDSTQHTQHTQHTYIHHSLSEMDYDADSTNPLHHDEPFHTECRMEPVEIINPEVIVREFIDNMTLFDLTMGSTYEVTSIIRDRVPEADAFTIYSIELMVVNKRMQVQAIHDELAALTDERVVELGHTGLVEIINPAAKYLNTTINDDVVAGLIDSRLDAVVTTTTVSEEHPMFPIFQALLIRRPDLFPSVSDGVLNCATIQHIESEYGVDLYEFEYDELLAVAAVVQDQDAANPTLLMLWDTVPVMLADRGYKIIGNVQHAIRASDSDEVLTFINCNDWEYHRETISMRDLAMMIFDHLNLDRTSVQVMDFTDDGIQYRIK